MRVQVGVTRNSEWPSKVSAAAHEDHNEDAGEAIINLRALIRDTVKRVERIGTALSEISDALRIAKAEEPVGAR